MKKYILTSILFLAAVAVWSANDPNTVSSFDRYNTYSTKTFFFGGFEFTKLESYLTTIGLQKIVENNYQEVIGKTTGKYTIIGYSMGGLTALGYAGHLNRTNPTAYNKIEGVITISGADKGAKLLEGGIGATYGRLMGKVNILWGGIKSTLVAALPHLAFILPTNTAVAARNYFVDKITPTSINAVIKAAIDQISPKYYAQIRDLIPESDFIKQNVAGIQAHPYKRQTGTKAVIVIKWRGIFPYLTTRYDPVYSYYTDYEDKIKFGNTVPVAYLVGLNNSMLSLANEKEAEIRNVLKGFRIAFGIAEGIHIARSFTIVGLLGGSIGYAQDAARAWQFANNPDRELQDIIRSTEGDGFIAKESQYYRKSFTDPNTGAVRKSSTTYLGNPSLGYYGFTNNHASINPYASVSNKAALFSRLDILVDTAKRR
jgi:pimeloyl-ACP methyl ester carboxylesterase